MELYLYENKPAYILFLDVLQFAAQLKLFFIFIKLNGESG